MFDIFIIVLYMVARQEQIQTRKTEIILFNSNYLIQL